MKSNSYTVFLKFILPFLSIAVFFSNLRAQEENQIVKEKMICQKIELFVNGQRYDDGHKCVSADAICYLVEGLSLSCFANPNLVDPTLHKQNK